MRSVTKKAYGKVNLFLAVGGKRADGRHDVETVMCRVGIYDTVTVTLTDSGIALTCDDGMLPVNEENIAFLAAKLYFEHSAYNGGCRIAMEKRIPVKAGMGGGSSDAAAVLSALDMLIGDVSFDTLVSIAASIGADVPFFLYEKSVMLGTGTGAELTECGELGFDVYGVFVTYGEKPSTGAAYRMLDEVKGEDTALKSADKLIKAMQGDDFFAFAGEIVNDFELCSATFSEVSGALLELGCAGAFLSGSGPTVCGICKTEDEARLVSEALKYPSFVARLGV